MALYYPGWWLFEARAQSRKGRGFYRKGTGKRYGPGFANFGGKRARTHAISDQVNARFHPAFDLGRGPDGLFQLPERQTPAGGSGSRPAGYREYRALLHPEALL